MPSPRPISVLESPAIDALIRTGTIVIAGGGGGVPVVPLGSGLRGVEAVIDKDYVAGLLARSLAAQALVFVTDVPRLMLDFGQPGERALTELDVQSAERHQRDGQFPAGSMGPKVDAATQFLRSGGEIAVISTSELVAGTLGTATGGGPAEATATGTRIVPTRHTARTTT